MTLDITLSPTEWWYTYAKMVDGYSAAPSAIMQNIMHEHGVTVLGAWNNKRFNQDTVKLRFYTEAHKCMFILKYRCKFAD
jgi:hypothetical protein